MSKKRIITIALALVLLLSLSFGSWKLMDYHKGAKDYDEAAALALGGFVNTRKPSASSSAPSSKPDRDPSEASSEAPASGSSESASSAGELASSKPPEDSEPAASEEPAGSNGPSSQPEDWDEPLDPEDTPPPSESPAPVDEFAEGLAQIDLKALQEVNPQVIGWICIPDTEVNYPILQAEDNQHYLNYTWKDERSSVGSIFLEHTNKPDFSGFNTIIYGHRMRDTSMFGTLPLYSSLEFFQQHPTIYVADSSGVHQYDIFAAYEVGVREMVYRLDIDQPEEIQELIQFCLSHSVIQTGVVPGVEDSILTLSTCTERGHSTRWVVQAVLREDGGEAN